MSSRNLVESDKNYTYIELIQALDVLGLKSTLAVTKHFPQILVTFKIKNLATSHCVKECVKVAPWQG
jgi:hypothetical protein